MLANTPTELLAGLPLFIPKYLEHAFTVLFAPEKLRGDSPPLVTVDDDMLGSGNQAMLNTAIAAKALLVRPCVEKTEV